MTPAKHSSSNTSGPQTFELEWQCYRGIQTIRSIQATPCSRAGGARSRASSLSHQHLGRGRHDHHVLWLAWPCATAARARPRELASWSRVRLRAACDCEPCAISSRERLRAACEQHKGVPETHMPPDRHARSCPHALVRIACTRPSSLAHVRHIGSHTVLA